MGTPRAGLAFESEGRAWIVEGLVESFVASIAMADSVSGNAAPATLVAEPSEEPPSKK
jgi:hypothetical protein